jgi:hypothetical protein
MFLFVLITSTYNEIFLSIFQDNTFLYFKKKLKGKISLLNMRKTTQITHKPKRTHTQYHGRSYQKDEQSLQ